MIILDWNDDFDDYSDQRRAWPTAVGVPPRSPSSSRPGPMDLLRLGEIWKYQEKFFSSNWEVNENLKILQRMGFSLHKSFFFFRFGTSYTTRDSQSLQSRYAGNDIDKVPVIWRTWLLFAPLLKRSQLWIQRLSSRLPTILSTAWKWTRQELWYALVLQTGSIYHSGSLSPCSSPGCLLFPRSASLIQLDNSLASCSKLDRTNANDMFDRQCCQTSDYFTNFSLVC